jgi:hypothetical protein
MAHAHCMLDDKGYKHALRICNTYCLPLLQWQHERAWMLRFTFDSLLVCLNILLQQFMLEPGKSVVKERHESSVPHTIEDSFSSTLFTRFCCTMDDFRLPQRWKWGTSYSEMLPSVDWKLVFDISGQPIGSIFCGQAGSYRRFETTIAPTFKFWSGSEC